VLHPGRWLGWGLFVALLAYAAAFAAVLVVSRRDGRRPSDVIAVLGAAQYNGRPSPVFKARLDHAAELYAARLSRRVVVMGGRAEGDREAEAEVGRRYLQVQGVPRRAAFAVPEGRDTQESIAALAAWMKERELGSVLFVSDPFHLLRLRLDASGHGFTVATSPTTTSPISKDWRRELPYLAWEAAKLPVALARAALR
jgi:uncharacterized SAM-binding protein YcdF (DUF218 family)